MTVRDNGDKPIDPVAYRFRCPTCAERECDELVWIDEERVECRRCRTVYRPGGSDDVRDAAS